MIDRTERRIGEIFRDPDTGIKLEVVYMPIMYCCQGCWYHHRNGCGGAQVCSRKCRSDENDIIFVDAAERLQRHIDAVNNCK